MITVKWLNGELEQVQAPITVGSLRSEIRNRYGRNFVVSLFQDTSDISDEQVLQDNDEIFVIVSPEKQMQDSESDRVNHAFRTHCNKLTEHMYDQLRSIIKDSNALIAGGSVVCALTDAPVNDFDVYVHYSQALALIRRLHHECNLTFESWKIHMGSMYDESFFRRNHILIRIPMFCRFRRGRHDHRVFRGNHANYDIADSLNIDVIVLPDEVPLLDVITNFDLSFCESWWDGDKVYSEDPDGIRLRNGRLKRNYWQALFRDLNMFTIRRIKKYQKRGFHITTCDDPYLTFADLFQESVGDNEDEKGDEKEDEKGDEKDDTFYEDWAIRTFYNHAKNLFWRGHRESNGLQEVAFFFQCYPNSSRLTYKSLTEKWVGHEGLFNELVSKVFSEIWTELQHKPEPYRQKFMQVFHLTDADYDSSQAIDENLNIWNHDGWHEFWRETINTLRRNPISAQNRIEQDDDQYEHDGEFAPFDALEERQNMFWE